MSTPEAQPEIPPDQQMQEIPSAPEIPAHVEQATGVQATPAAPQPVTDDNNQPVAQPIPAPPAPSGPSITIPANDQAVLTQMSQGDASNSQTWLGVFWLFKIKKALRSGMQVIFGGQR